MKNTKNIKNKALKFLKDKRLETWVWESANALIVLLGAMALEVNLWWSIPVYGLLNQVTKWININYLKS